MDFIHLELYHRTENEAIQNYKKQYPSSEFLNYLYLKINQSEYILLFESKENTLTYKVFENQDVYTLIYKEEITDSIKKSKAKKKYYLMKYFLKNDFTEINKKLLVAKNNLMLFNTIFENKENKYNMITLYIEKHLEELLYVQKNEAIFYINTHHDSLYQRYYIKDYKDFNNIYAELKNEEKINKEQDDLLNKIMYSL